MHKSVLAYLALLSATAGMAQSSGFLLGMDYSEWFNPNASQIAADGSGALYILSPCPNFEPSFCVTKLSADGETILWQNALGFTAGAMAVDPNGGVYLVPGTANGEPTPLFVEKLSADGASVSWKTQIEGLPTPALLAVDSTGRAFVAVAGQADGVYVVVLTAAGAIDYTTIPSRLVGAVTALAVDPTGAYVVISTGSSRLAWVGRFVTFIATVPQVTQGLAFAVAGNGDAIVSGSDINGHWLLQRLSYPGGAVVFSDLIPANSRVLGLAADGAGSAYVTGYSGSVMHPVRNSLAACGSTWLSVFGPDGAVLQTTYIPGVTSTGVATALVAASPNSTIFLAIHSDPLNFAPTQTGPFPASGEALLARFSPNANAQILPLACVGNAASYNAGPIVPGEIVTLFGSGLGPQQGVQTEAALQTPYPTQAAGVEVTFDGKPTPLLWVRDAQINAVVPWSVTGKSTFAGQTTQVCVSYNDVPTNCLLRPLAEAAPGVFMVDGVYAAALNQDGTVNSVENPAPLGSVVSVFATGLGPINPPQTDGSLVGVPPPVDTLPVNLTYPFCSIPCAPEPTDTLVSAGPAPSLVAGASQISFQANFSIAMGLLVETPSQPVSSNNFQVYVANP